LYVYVSQQKKMLQKNSFLIWAFLFAFFGQKTAKIDKKLRKLAKSKPFDEIFWNLACRCFSTQENATKKHFSVSAFFGLFWPKKQSKLTKNEENCQNPNVLNFFSEIWYVDAFQHKKIQHFFLFKHFWASLVAKNQPKLIKNEENTKYCINLDSKDLWRAEKGLNG